ncbi:2-isopropylmalate synthase [bacterium]|nr:2-isopropylmalate synthase [bacterium]
MILKKSNNLIFDWNKKNTNFFPEKTPQLDDETLRDGLQSPSVKTPTMEEKIKIIHLINDLGIESANIGLPGAGKHVEDSALKLAQEISNQKLNIYPNCAARTLRIDVEPVIRIQQKTGLKMEVSTFIGSSPIRQYAEGWTIDKMLKDTEDSVSFAIENGLDVMYVTEDTTRADPEDLKKLYGTAIECGAKRVTICDTVGHATPQGVKALVSFIRNFVDNIENGIQVDWHGHRDRGLDMPNTLAAIEAGADRVHGTALGIGERVGNTPIDQLLVNFQLLGWIDRDLSKLSEYVKTVSDATGVPIPKGYPVIGEDAFRTGTGVHAAAVIKALKKGDNWLADRVYSGVPAANFGLKQKIEIGPMSGKSNIIFWLRENGYEEDETIIEAIFQTAKKSKKILAEKEIHKLASS